MKFHKWMVAAAMIAVAGCGGEETGDRIDLGAEAQRAEGRDAWPAELTERVDAGNAAYAAGDYEQAAEIFEGITEDYPDMGVAYFGVYMAHDALGNAERAAEALQQAEARAPGLGQMHDAARDTSMGGMRMMPEGHPGTGMPEGHPGMPGMPEGHPPVQPGDSAPALPMGSGG